MVFKFMLAHRSVQMVLLISRIIFLGNRLKSNEYSINSKEILKSSILSIGPVKLFSGVKLTLSRLPDVKSSSSTLPSAKDPRKRFESFPWLGSADKVRLNFKTLESYPTNFEQVCPFDGENTANFLLFRLMISLSSNLIGQDSSREFLSPHEIKKKEEESFSFTNLWFF